MGWVHHIGQGERGVTRANLIGIGYGIFLAVLIVFANETRADVNQPPQIGEQTQGAFPICRTQAAARSIINAIQDDGDTPEDRYWAMVDIYNDLEELGVCELNHGVLTVVWIGEEPWRRGSHNGDDIDVWGIKVTDSDGDVWFSNYYQRAVK